jgi:hypothetical protein
LVYVSCAPDTLRRDAVTIAAAGYALRFAAWIDSMPMTPHLELVTAWARVEGAAPARDATRGGAADHVGDPLDDIPTR